MRRGARPDRRRGASERRCDSAPRRRLENDLRRAARQTGEGHGVATHGRHYRRCASNVLWTMSLKPARGFRERFGRPRGRAAGSTSGRGLMVAVASAAWRQRGGHGSRTRAALRQPILSDRPDFSTASAAVASRGSSTATTSCTAVAQTMSPSRFQERSGAIDERANERIRDMAEYWATTLERGGDLVRTQLILRVRRRRGTTAAVR